MTRRRKLSVAFATSLFLSATPLHSQALPIITEIYADPASDLAGDANSDGIRSTYDDEFIELFNPDTTAVDISGWTLSDSVSVRHLFPEATYIPSGETVVVFGGGTPINIPGIVYIASSGGLGLNNGGDTVSLSDGATVIDAVTYGSEGGNDEALTRYPLLEGEFVLHSSVPGASEALFSPGTSATGLPYAVTPHPLDPPAPPVTVPEPGPVALLLAGLICLILTRRKQVSVSQAG